MMENKAMAVGQLETTTSASQPERTPEPTDQERMYAYAKELWRQKKFLSFFVYDLCTSLNLELYKRDKSYAGRNPINLNEMFAQFCKWPDFQVEINNPAFWVKNAEWSLERLDAIKDGRDIGEVLEETLPAVLVPTGSDYKKHPEKFVEEAILTACASNAVEIFLKRLRIECFRQDLLEELLGFKKRVRVSTSKFGGLQKLILTKVWQQANLTGAPRVEWDPAELLRDQETLPNKAAIARALAKLERRGLLIRERLRGKPQTRRTSHVELTSLGNGVAKRLLDDSQAST